MLQKRYFTYNSDEETVAKLQDTAENTLNFNIDLEKQNITYLENNEQKEITFEIDPVKKKCLIEGPVSYTHLTLPTIDPV